LRIKRKYVQTAVYAMFILLLIIAGLGRVVSLPVFLFIVSGKSMLPTLHPGDVVIAIRGPFSKGDIIVWCSTPIYCVAHRVQKLGNGFVITKGDANPLEDPPIPTSMVMYKVIGKIPNYLWLTPLLSLLIYLSYKRIYAILILRPKVVKKEKVLRLTTTVIALFILFNVSALLLTPLPAGTARYYIPKPNVELKTITPIEYGVLMDYNIRFTRIVNVNKCVTYLLNETYYCTYWKIRNNTLSLRIPEEAYQYAYLKGANRLSIMVNVSLENGWFTGNYTIPLTWRKLEVSLNRTLIEVSNSNPIPFNVSVRILYINYSSTGKPKLVMVQNLGSIIIKPYSTWSYAVTEKSAYAYVELEYVFRGEKVFERKKIVFEKV